VKILKSESWTHCYNKFFPLLFKISRKIRTFIEYIHEHCLPKLACSFQSLEQLFKKLTAQFAILEIERKDKNQTFNKHFEGGDNTEKTEESLFCKYYFFKIKRRI